MSLRGKPKKEYEVIHDHRRCEGGGGTCKNIVTHWAQPVGYTGKVYCKDHASEARAR